MATAYFVGLKKIKIILSIFRKYDTHNNKNFNNKKARATVQNVGLQHPSQGL